MFFLGLPIQRINCKHNGGYRSLEVLRRRQSESCAHATQKQGSVQTVRVAWRTTTSPNWGAGGLGESGWPFGPIATWRPRGPPWRTVNRRRSGRGRGQTGKGLGLGLGLRQRLRLRLRQRLRLRLRKAQAQAQAQVSGSSPGPGPGPDSGLRLRAQTQGSGLRLRVKR